MNPRSPDRRKKWFPQDKTSAFTLLELLVVISIILILAAFSVPTLKSMQRKSLVIKCANNLRQIHTAFTSYLSDNNNTIFWRGANLGIDGMDWYVYGGQETGNKNTGQQGLFNRFVPRPLNPYVDGSMQIFRCPSDTQDWAGGHTSFDSVGTSYNFNANGPLEGGTLPGLSGTHLNAISKPASTVLFYDASLAYAPGRWHGEQENVCFLDGHLETLSYPALRARMAQVAQ